MPSSLRPKKRRPRKRAPTQADGGRNVKRSTEKEGTPKYPVAIAVPISGSSRRKATSPKERSKTKPTKASTISKKHADITQNIRSSPRIRARSNLNAPPPIAATKRSRKERSSSSQKFPAPSQEPPTGVSRDTTSSISVATSSKYTPSSSKRRGKISSSGLKRSVSSNETQSMMDVFRANRGTKLTAAARDRINKRKRAKEDGEKTNGEGNENDGASSESARDVSRTTKGSGDVPSSNLKSGASEEEKEEEEVDTSAVLPSALRNPQLRLVNGEFVMDDRPQITISTDDLGESNSGGFSLGNVEEKNLYRIGVTSAAFKKNRAKATAWTVDETRTFFKGLRDHGADFSAIAKIFGSDRNRRQVKLKFKKEEREHPKLIDLALKASFHRRLRSSSSSKEESENESADNVPSDDVGASTSAVSTPRRSSRRRITRSASSG